MSNEVERTGYPRLNVTRRDGSERFHDADRALNFNLLGFWQWVGSDLVSNAMRGKLAEYIVATALGLADGVRVEWDAFDLLTRTNKRIEVKSAAYLQAWSHKKLSAITFGIRPTREWSQETNLLSDDLKRHADVYVFCVLRHQDKTTLDPPDLGQWEFYVFSAAALDQKHPVQKTIGLASLLRLNPVRAAYRELAAIIEAVA